MFSANENPSLIVVDNSDYIDLYDDAYTSPSSNQYKNRAVWDWVAENGDDALGLVNGVLCTIKPNRPGCSGNKGGQQAFFQQDNTTLYILIAVVIVLALVIIFKK